MLKKEARPQARNFHPLYSISSISEQKMTVLFFLRNKKQLRSLGEGIDNSTVGKEYERGSRKEWGRNMKEEAGRRG